ncbi:uncharacterized protein [Rutidosis leptorrhynchoides]|uniref:uncharacterized protein n=1 Tax=Rutidosis leptorrhynchoides TaxID=125765 RepID=UPI003A99AEDA
MVENYNADEKKEAFSQYNVGVLKNDSFWHDPLVNRQSLKDLFPDIQYQDAEVGRDVRIKDVWRNGKWLLPSPVTSDLFLAWKMVEETQFSSELETIVQWKAHNSGTYSISSSYEVFKKKGLKVFWHSLVWGKGLYPKRSFIFWMAVNNKLAVKAHLYRWGVCDSQICCLCGVVEETINYMYFECVFSANIWMNVMPHCGIIRQPRSWSRELAWFSRKAIGKSGLAHLRRMAFAAMVYYIWLERNSIAFSGNNGSITTVTRSVRNAIFLAARTDSAVDKHLLEGWYV